MLFTMNKQVNHR